MSEVRLTEEEAATLNAVIQDSGEIWGLTETLAAAVEDIIATRVAAAGIAGQMRHITAEMVRGDQPDSAKEEFIADIRARLSHTEAERDHVRSQYVALSAEVRRRVPQPLLMQGPTADLYALLAPTTAEPTNPDPQPTTEDA